MKRTFTHTRQRWLLERTGRLPTVPGLPAVPRWVPTEYHVFDRARNMAYRLRKLFNCLRAYLRVGTRE